MYSANIMQPMGNHRLFSTTLAITAGLVTAQVVGTLQVGWSNRVLFNRTRAVVEAGYLAVPNDLIEPGLLSFKAAFGGGLFFTLTLGAFLSFLTVGWLQLSKGIFGRRKWGIGLAVGMIAGLVILNFNGFNLFATAYILFVPLVVCFFYGNGGVRTGQRHTIFHSFCLLCPIVILSLAYFTFLGHHIFIDVRDHVLLPNSPGRMVNDFYYRYTLYPAESFKSLSQKQIRTFYLDGFENSSLKPVLTDILVSRDYFPVATGNDGDVIVKSANADFLVLKARGRAVRVKKAALLDRPDQALQSFADISDNNRWFRKLIYISLLTGFPLLVYFIIFGLVRRLFAWVFPLRLSIIGALVVCIGIGLMILWVLVVGKSSAPAQLEISDLAGSSDRRQRLVALKVMDQEGINPYRYLAQYPAYPSVLKSGNIAERYWLARVLGNGREEKTYLDLIRMLDDPSPNVVCMALRSLGKRGNEQAKPIILNRMEGSDNWYIQWYGYNALKNLKWRQHKLK